MNKTRKVAAPAPLSLLDKLTGPWQWWTVAIISFMVYANAIPNDYNMDDELVTRNHRLTSKGISAIGEIFREPYYKDKAGYAYEYRPVVLTSFAIEHSIFGESAAVSHLINVLFYTALCLLLLSVLRQLLQNYSPLVPLGISLLFATHPIHTEVVASIKNRDEILAVLFSLLAFTTVLSYAKSNNLLFLLAAVPLYLLALLSKQTSTVFLIFIPVALLLFCDVKPRHVFLTYLALALAAFPALNLPNITSKLTIFAGAFLFLIFLYLLKNQFSFSTLASFISNTLSEMLHSLQSVSDEKENTTPHSQVPPQFPAAFLYTSVALLLMFCGFAGVYLMNTPLLFATIFLLATFFAFTPHYYKVYVFIPYSTFLLFAAIFCSVSTNFLLFNLLIVSTLLAVYSVSVTRWLSLGVTLFIVLLLIIYFHDFATLVVVLLFASFISSRYKIVPYIGLLILSGVFVWIGYKAIFKNQIDVPFFTQVFPYVTLQLVVQLRKPGFKFVPYISLALLIVSLVFGWNQVAYPTNPGKVKEKLIEWNWSKPGNIAPAVTNRPLQKMETPVRKSSPLNERIGTASVILLKYARLVVLPYPMAFYYGYKEIDAVPVSSPVAIAGLFIYALLFLIGCYAIYKRYTLIGFGLVLYAISIASFTNLFIDVPGMMGDRFLFVPALGFCFVLVGVLFLGFKTSDVNVAMASRLGKSFRYTFIAILIFYSALTIARNSDWKNHLTLFRNDIKHVQQSAQAHNLLGLHSLLQAMQTTNEADKQVLLNDAITHLKQAVEIYPDFKNASFDLGRAYLLAQKPNEALEAFKITLRIDSTFVTPCLDMGTILYNQGKLDEAIYYYEKYLTRFPNQLPVYANLSFAYYQKKDYAASVQVNRRAIALNPYAYEPVVNIGKTFLAIQQRDSALYYFRKAALLQPNEPNIRRAINELERQGR